MKKSVIILIHLAYWFCLTFIAFIIYAAVINMPGAPTNASIYFAKLVFSMVYLPAAIGFYVFYFPIFNLFNKKW